jgi:hypothetical protein
VRGGIVLDPLGGLVPVEGERDLLQRRSTRAHERGQPAALLGQGQAAQVLTLDDE